MIITIVKNIPAPAGPLPHAPPVPQDADLTYSQYHIVAEFSAPAIYNYWAVVALDIFLVIMWLASFRAARLRGRRHLRRPHLLRLLQRQLLQHGRASPAPQSPGPLCLAAAAGLGGLQL